MEFLGAESTLSAKDWSSDAAAVFASLDLSAAKTKLQGDIGIFRYSLGLLYKGPDSLTESVARSSINLVARAEEWVNAFVLKFGVAEVPQKVSSDLSAIAATWAEISKSAAAAIPVAERKKQIEEARYQAVMTGNLESPYLTDAEREYYREAAKRGEVQLTFGISEELETQIAKSSSPVKLPLPLMVAAGGVLAFLAFKG